MVAPVHGMDVEMRTHHEACAESLFEGHRHSHRIPSQHYLCLGLWTMFLTAGYALTRLVCVVAHSPPDYHQHTTWLQTLYDLQQLWTFGIILAFFTGIHMPSRFGYLFCFRRAR